eukprot:g8165.t1
MSQGGSAAMREAIEARRSKIKTPGASLKTLEKDAKRKKEWWNEKIKIACIDIDGEPMEGCAWKVPRHRLTEATLKTMCLTCPAHLKIEYLKDLTTGDIVWPPDAQMSCHPPPWSYAAVAVEEQQARRSSSLGGLGSPRSIAGNMIEGIFTPWCTIVVDRSKDPSYYGDVQIMIFNVPLKTVTESTQVTSEEVKAWLLCGLLEEDEDVKEAQQILRALEAEAKVVEQNLSRVGYMKFTEKVGFSKEERQTLTDEEQAERREERHQALSAQRDKMEEDVKEARDILEGILKQRKETPVHLEQANVRPKIGTCTYYVSFPGFYGPTLADVVCAKTDWMGIKLAASHDDLPPWAGRGEIPDGSKSYIKRYTEHAVNMRGAQICRLQHGFGQHKVARVRKPKQASIENDVADVGLGISPATGLSSPPKTPISTRNSTRGGTRSVPTTPTNTNTPLASKPPGTASSVPGSPTPSARRTAGNSRGGERGAGVGIGALGGGGNTQGGRRGGEEKEAPPPPFAGKEFYFYHGEFVEGLKSGFGVEFTDADVYYGEYKQDKRNGVGSLHCANGDSIEGHFVSETRFPEAPSVTNPYTAGVCHGNVEIKFATGGSYTGTMRHGRITGRGEFVTCLGERYSGDFLDGRLHGKGSKMDVVGQVWEGSWREGVMHGEGRYSAPESGEFEGDWVDGEFQGKGRITFKGGNTYEGFFLDHNRSGPGTLFRGNVKRVYDPRSGRKTLRSNRIYEGNWRANELRSGSMVTMTKAGVSYCAGSNKDVWYNRVVDRIKRRETQTRRKALESLDFYGRYERLLRTLVEKKKSRLYAKQARQANQDLIDHHTNKLGAEDLREVFQARAINLDQIMRVTGKQLERGAGSGSIAKASEKLEWIATSRGTTSNGTLLSRLLLSRLEEAQELQELVNLTEMAKLAESNAFAEQAEMNYVA